MTAKSIYILEISKHGYTEKYASNLMSKLHRQLIKSLTELEIGVTKKEIQSPNKLQVNVRNITPDTPFQKKIRNTKIKVSRVYTL